MGQEVSHYSGGGDVIEEGHIVSHEVVVSPEVTFLQAKAEIDHQVATARAFPRSITTVRKQLMDLVALSPVVAQQCTYILPRGGKSIVGPSVRFAEILVSCWGNSQGAARVVRIEAENVVAQAVFFDLEKNVKLTYEVSRRITNREGKRFDNDMIVVTGNAACAIALRNAILKGIPKAFWEEAHQKAQLVARGDEKSLNSRRTEAMKRLVEMNIAKEKVFAFLRVKGFDDLTLDHLALLAGVLNAIKEGSTTADEAFAPGNEADLGDGSTPARPKPDDFKEGSAPATNAKSPEPSKDKPKDGEKPKEETTGEVKTDRLAAYLDEIAATLGTLDEGALRAADEAMRVLFKQEDREGDLLPKWVKAFDEREAAIKAAKPKSDPVPDDPKEREYQDWLKDQYAVLDRATMSRTVDDIEIEVLANCRMGDKAAFKKACNDKAKALLSGKTKKKG